MNDLRDIDEYVLGLLDDIAKGNTGEDDQHSFYELLTYIINKDNSYSN